MSKLGALVIIGLTLGACGASAPPRTFYAADHAPVLPPRPPATVEMFYGDPPARPVRFLGELAVDLGDDFRLDQPAPVALLRELQARGAEHGCDAVVLVKHARRYWPGDRVPHGMQYASCLQYTDAHS